MILVFIYQYGCHEPGAGYSFFYQAIGKRTDDHAFLILTRILVADITLDVVATGLKFQFVSHFAADADHIGDVFCGINLYFFYRQMLRQGHTTCMRRGDFLTFVAYFFGCLFFQRLLFCFGHLKRQKDLIRISLKAFALLAEGKSLQILNLELQIQNLLFKIFIFLRKICGAGMLVFELLNQLLF